MNILDCTLRDGGYYNNWNFSLNLIRKYFSLIGKINIKYIEIGFRFPNKDSKMGLTAYSEDNFINNLKISKKIKVGIMINASDFINNDKVNIVLLKKTFPNNNNLNFVRVACHAGQIFKIKPIIKYLKKKFIVMINLMQISEVDKKELKKIIYFINKLGIKVFYIADSLGALKPEHVYKILKLLKNEINCEIGIHAHDNLGFAYKNSMVASYSGALWIDSTINGMGRGAGNLKTEKILRLDKSKKKLLNSFIKKNFEKLKKKYKWGKNIYYNLAGKYKIHPTYIQNLLNENRTKYINLKKIILNLRKIGAKKYNPLNLYFSLKIFSKKNLNSFGYHKFFKDKKILILGSDSLKKMKKKIENKIKIENFYVITLNNNFEINKKFQNLRVICHPLRLLSFEAKNKKFNTPIVAPFFSINKSLRSKLFSEKVKILNYGIELSNNHSIKIYKNYLSTNDPLALTYILSILNLAKVREINLAGFKAYKNDDYHKDNSEKIFGYFSKKIRFKKLYLN